MSECYYVYRDLEIVKNEKGIFISHRDNAFDLLHVNETSSDIPTEEENKDEMELSEKEEEVVK